MKTFWTWVRCLSWMPWVALLASHAAAAQGSSVVVLALHAEFGVDPAVASLLSQQVEEQMRAAHAFERVLGQGDLQALIGGERSAQLTQCDSEGCLAELAGSFGASSVLKGSIGKLGGSHLLTLRLLDVSRAAVVATVSERIRGEGGDALLDGVPAAVVKLLDGAHITHQLKAPASAAPPASTKGMVAPAVEETGGGPPWRVLGALGLGGAAVSILLVAPVLALAAYLGVGLMATFAFRSGTMGDVVGGVAALVSTVLPVLLGAAAAAFAVFAFTRPSVEAKEQP